jgi:glucosyl-3-phosphoglycerate phosphatase
MSSGGRSRSVDAKNTYVLLRHGQSKANVRGVIVSRPSIGVREEHGLTEKGREQAAAAGRRINELLKLSGQSPVVFTSDFSRAFETACIVSQCLERTAELRVDSRLRERNFGYLEGSPSSVYESVWANDSILGTDGFVASQRAAGADDVESVYSVRGRMLQVVSECNVFFANRLVLLVGHGDALQILETAFRGLRPWDHRSLAHLSNCEVRQVSSFA